MSYDKTNKYFVGNNMKILEELYDGNFSPNKKIKISDSEIKATNDLLKISREIHDALPTEKQNLIIIYEQLSNEITKNVARKKFIEGYKLGSRIMLEVLEKN